MARSLRSHTKKRTRAIKRETVFKPVEDARLERLAHAQAEAAKKPSVGDYMEADKEVEVKADEKMEVEGEDEKKKISTSGPRSNRHARKLKEKKKKGKKSALKF